MDQVKGVKETGIQRFRHAGDVISSLAHDYHDIAMDDFAADPSKAYGHVTPDGATVLFQ